MLCGSLGHKAKECTKKCMCCTCGENSHTFFSCPASCKLRAPASGNPSLLPSHRNPASCLSTTKSSARIRGAASLSGEGSLSGNSNKERDVDSGDVEDDENVEQHHESASPEPKLCAKPAPSESSLLRYHVQVSRQKYPLKTLQRRDEFSLPSVKKRKTSR